MLLLLPAAALGILPLKMLVLAGAVLAVAIAIVLSLPRRVEGLVGHFFEALRVGRSRLSEYPVGRCTPPRQ